jgi:cytosine/adenosine deaminase-related metal-dependent hydrolase
VKARGAALRLRNAKVREEGGWVLRDLAIQDGRLVEPAALRSAREADLGGRQVVPALVNAHDHLDLSTFPALGTPPYANAGDWAADVEAHAADGRVKDALAVALADRLFLGGLRNLLGGAAAVAHHGAFHRSMAREDFPVRVLSRYSFALSPGATPALRKTYRTTDRRIPWLVHVGEGTDPRARDELQALVAANVLRRNTVLIHAIAFGAPEAERIATARSCVVWCPEANRRLYGATAAVPLLRAAGVRVGLGSDSPASGARDPLSNLAAAHREGVLGEDELLETATAVSAEVARLPVGRPAPGGVADLIVTDDLGALVGGDRRALSLMVVGGRPLFGEPALIEGLGRRPVSVAVAGRPKALDGEIGRRASSLWRAHPAVRRAGWMADLHFDAPLEPLRTAR